MWEPCLFVTSSLVRRLYAAHVTGKRMSGVLRADTQCARITMMYGLQGDATINPSAAEACAWSGFAFSSGRGSALCHPTPA